MRHCSAPIILLCAILFLADSIRAQQNNETHFDDMWSILIGTLNLERSQCDNIGLDSSVDLFAHNQTMKHSTRESLRSTIPKIAHTSLDTVAIVFSVLQEINTNPNLNTHRFKDGEQIGFCFGRALAVHYLLLNAGVNSCSIYKIFALGDLLVNSQFWRFHVAVLIFDPRIGFVVVDPSFGEPLSVDAWMQQVERYDFKYPRPQTRFYVTDPRKFLPAPGVYNLDTLGSPVLREYFTVLGQYLSEL